MNNVIKVTHIPMFTISILVLVVLFWGSPDLMDAIIYKLTGFKGWE